MPSCEFTAFVPLLQRSVPACLGRLEATARHCILVGCAPHRSANGVATGPGLAKACNSFMAAFGFFLTVAHATLFPCVYCPYYAIFEDVALRPNVMKSSGVCN